MPPTDPRENAHDKDLVEHMAGFYPIAPDAHQMLRRYTVARVSLPREVLGDLGLVPDVNRIGGPIEADVVFGEDGLARGIRLAPGVRRSE